jgi:hypothetical protein
MRKVFLDRVRTRLTKNFRSGLMENWNSPAMNLIKEIGIEYDSAEFIHAVYSLRPLQRQIFVQAFFHRMRPSEVTAYLQALLNDSLAKEKRLTEEKVVLLLSQASSRVVETIAATDRYLSMLITLRSSEISAMSDEKEECSRVVSRSECR